MIRAKLSKGGDAKLQGLTVSVDSQLQILLSLHCFIIYYTLCNDCRVFYWEKVKEFENIQIQSNIAGQYQSIRGD